MTLMISTMAAIICSILWYKKDMRDKWNIGVLCWMFWGASLMWSVDFAYAYMEEGAAVFVPAAEEMLNDAFLGMSVVIFAMVIWLVCLFAKDPSGVVSKVFLRR